MPTILKYVPVTFFLVLLFCLGIRQHSSLRDPLPLVWKRSKPKIDMILNKLVNTAGQEWKNDMDIHFVH